MSIISAYHHVHSLKAMRGRWQLNHAVPLYLLLCSKHSTTMSFMTCFSASPLCVWMTLIFCWSLQDSSVCLQSPSVGENQFFCQIQEVWIQCLDHLLAGLHHLWRKCTVQIDFFTKVRKQMAATQFCHTAAMFSEDCQLPPPKTTPLWQLHLFFFLLLYTWTPEANTVCLRSSSKVSSPTVYWSTLTITVVTQCEGTIIFSVIRNSTPLHASPTNCRQRKEMQSRNVCS